MSGEEPLYRLDPDRAASAAKQGGEQQAPAVVDPRRYRWAIGVFGLALLIAFSIYQIGSHGLATPGVPAGGTLRFFAAPLAASTLNGDANLAPPCSSTRHDPRALNVCLLAQHRALVLAFFVAGSQACVQQVDALQAASSRFPPDQVQFAAVAVRAGHAETAALVRSHRWSIPVAYDRDGAVGGLYDVALCPLVELARPGGVVAGRLVGDGWRDPSALAVRVRALVRR